MSFRQNGRYGHVPPAQYGGAAPSGAPRRQSSFDDGDDTSYFGDPPAVPSRPGSSHVPYSNPAQNELFLGGSIQPPPRPPPALPISQVQQYAGYPPAPTQSPPTYNPQQFARAYSNASAHNHYSSQIYTNQQQQPSHTPYVPSAYHHPSSRQQSLPAYGGAVPLYTQQQSPPLQPQYHHHQASQYQSQNLTSPTQNAFAHAVQRTPFVPQHNAPLPKSPSPYGAPPPPPRPYSNGGMAYQNYEHRGQEMYFSGSSQPRDDFDVESFTDSISRSGSGRANMAYQPPPLTDSSPGLQRHPTGRGLPRAPVEEDEEGMVEWGVNGRSAEEEAQAQIYQDIEAAIMNNTTHRTSHSGDLLDGELGPGHSGRPVRNPTGVDRSNSEISLSTSQSYEYDDDDDSDLEAASGLEAMKLAEQEEARMGGGFGMFTSTPEPPSLPPIPAHGHGNDGLLDSSDSDYANVDMGMYGGGYDAHLSYGGSTTAGSYGELDDQSRPLPTPSQLQRNSQAHEPAPGLGGMTDYSMPGESAMHPFPAFDAIARTDMSGTGGLQRPTSHRPRLSFDEGDEALRFTESRAIDHSSGDSPNREDMPDMFYHPGMSATSPVRPLPALPPVPYPSESQAYSHSHSYSHGLIDSYRDPYPSNADDPFYTQEGMLSPNASFVPRSASLSSHSSTPQVIPPVRSRTDAEERQARQRALKQLERPATYDGHDAIPLAVPLDIISLPVGRRRKINPSNIRTQEFARCTEPWALSGLATWVREMCGGETGDGENDLREKVITECLIALFTHKNPTMNIADAEVLSDRLVCDMFNAGVLIREEEWVKFGEGTISGVLWQMTGSGCFAPKLHEFEIPGRCYSHHCGRTLKKLNLSLEDIEPAKKTKGWQEFFELTAEQVANADRKEVHRQNALHEIVMAEDKYMEMLNVTRKLYRDQLLALQPPIIAPAKLPKFIAEVFGNVDAIRTVNQEHLLAQLKYRQQHEGPWIVGFSDIFREWVRKARQIYLEYAAGYSRSLYLVRREADRNILFRQFLEQASKNAMSNRLSWDTYIFTPLKRLQQYTLMLREVLKSSTQENEEKACLAVAIEEVNSLTLECDHKVDEMAKKVQLTELSHKLYLRPGMRGVELNLDHLGRELIFKGDLQRAGANRFTWLETHALLFDNYLVLAKTVPQREGPGGSKKEIYDVSKLPIPMQLLVLESTNDEAVRPSKGLAVTSAVRPTIESRPTRGSTGAERPSVLKHTDTESSVASGTSLTKTITNTNLENDTKLMFPFRIRHLGKSDVYTLYAPTAANRVDWCRKIVEAKEKHAASLFEQNAEPFKLKVIADSAFAYDGLSGSSARSTTSIRGTPLDRAIREIDKQYGPMRPSAVCRANVNCATTFTCFGKQMIAVGTDYGVFTTEENNPRGWQRSIQIARVTQITIIEEFFLCLIIADKSLIAYHLDMIVSYPSPLDNSSARRAPQKLSGTKDVAFFATARMKDRTLVFYKKRENLSSTFKVLEPVFQKSSEKRSKLFGRSKPFTSGSNTEFFREFDEFYIPSDCYSINLFHSYIAISTARGFELLTLDRKQPMSIPDLKQPEIATIAARLSGQKPLGMFRLSDAEFLLCYEECGVYISKHGEVSRSVVLEFVGKATSATLYGAYLVLFDNDFVEVRNAENGRLRQIIAGRDVRCLDYGSQGASGATSATNGVGGPERNLKIAMGHPEINGVQLLLEMSLNSGVTG